MDRYRELTVKNGGGFLKYPNGSFTESREDSEEFLPFTLMSLSP